LETTDMALLIGVFVIFIVAMVVLATLGIVAVLVSALFMSIIALGLAVAAAIGVSLLVTGGAATLTAAGVFAGIAAFVATLAGFNLLTRRGRRRRAREDRIAVTSIGQPRKPVAALPASRDPELDGAFARLAAHADGSRARLSVAQESCRLFLVLADQFPADMDAGDLAVRIRKRIPEHVETCLTMLESAKPLERQAYVDDAVSALEKVGAEAERHRTRLQSHAAHVLDLQRRHLTRGSGTASLSLD
jgi:hypothetical protein